jgi:TrmH family RNA methyltransferase
MLITSAANEHAQWARRVRDGREPSLVFVEGEQLSRECIDSETAVLAAFYRENSEPKLRALLLALRRRDCPLYPTDPQLFRSLSDTVNSQGVVLIAKRPDRDLNQILEDHTEVPALLVSLDRVQDPGNAGTIMRTAEAAGATGLVSLLGSVDAFSPKSLRASMGSAFRLPVVGGAAPESAIECFRQHRLRIVGTSREAQTDYTDLDWRGPTAVFFGNEASGLSSSVLTQCDVTVKVPLAAGVESLNVGAAAAVVLFEAARQRRISR